MSTTRAALEARIDLSAIAHNVQVISTAARAPVMAVVKADGYGHGAPEVARAALAAGAYELGVATLAEAILLRDAGIDAPILSWLHTPSTDFDIAVRRDIGIAVSSPAQLTAVIAAATRCGKHADVSVKIDTGLARNGVSEHDWPQMCASLATAVASEAITLRTAMCHLALGDDPHNPQNSAQSQRLDDCVADLRRAGVRPESVHVSNSAAALSRPDLSHDMVRAGIAMYGLSPLPTEYGDSGLIPAMTLSAELSSVKHVAAGQGVSYGHTWTPTRATTLGLVPAGYADGVPRLMSNRMRVQLGAQSVPQVGRVCMDQLVIDLGPCTDAQPGERVILFGAGNDGGPTATDWADTIGTIDYEIVSGIRGRAVRRYHDPHHVLYRRGHDL